jgi:Mg2+ and Co2+ transporter CorA
VNDINQSSASGENQPEESELFHLCSDIEAFEEAIVTNTGLNLDLTSVLELTTDFIQTTSQYMLMNLKEYDAEKPDNLLFLTEDEIFICSQNAPSVAAVESFEDVLQRSFGKTTIITFLLFNQLLDKHIQKLEVLTRNSRKLEEKFDHEEYRALSLEFERFSDRIEEFHNLIIGLQARRYKYVETQYITFDYRVLLAESQSLQARCRRRLSFIKDLRQDHEMKSTEELNARIIKLNDVVKKLTSITVILMLPTLIASHFGMNFYYMPELRVWWVYPTVIGAQVGIMAVFFFIFRKIGWL